MDQLDSRLKAEKINIQIEEVQPISDIQKLKVYNVSPIYKKNYSLASCRTLCFIAFN